MVSPTDNGTGDILADRDGWRWRDTECYWKNTSRQFLAAAGGATGSESYSGGRLEAVVLSKGITPGVKWTGYYDPYGGDASLILFNSPSCITG